MYIGVVAPITKFCVENVMFRMKNLRMKKYNYICLLLMQAPVARAENVGICMHIGQ